MSKRLNVIIQICLGLFALAGGVYVSITPANSLLRWYNIDDAFYYYKVAQNVLMGHGFTFDQINLANGFHPLWMVVSLGVFWLSKFNLLLPLRVLVIVSALFNAGTGVLLYRMLKRVLHPGAAIVGALVWTLYPSIFDTSTAHGMESSISAFFIVLLLLLATKYLNKPEGELMTLGELAVMGLVGGLTILSRLDNVFLVGIIGVFLLMKIKKIPTLVIFDLIAVSFSVLAAWTIRLGSEGVVLNSYSIYPMLAVSVLIKPVFFFFSGLYTRSTNETGFMTIFRVSIATALSFGFEYAILFGMYKLEITRMFSKSVVIFDVAIGFLLVALIHLFIKNTVPSARENPFSLFGKWAKRNWNNIILGGLSYGFPIAVLLGSYVTFNKLTFGTFTPISGQIKHWWSTMPNTIYSHANTLISVLGLSPADNYGPWSLATSKIYTAASSIAKRISWQNPQASQLIFGILLIALVVLFFIIMRTENGRLARKTFALLVPAALIGSLIQITYYTATGYSHTRGWYWITEMLTLVVIGSILLDGLFTLIDKPKRRINFSPFLVSLLAVSLVYSHISYILRLSPFHVSEEKQSEYLQEIKEVEFYTEEGANIGMTGGGMVAYFIENRTIINLDGLINSAEYFHALKTGTATAFLDKLPLNYVYGKPYVLLESDPYDEIFQNRLIEIGFIRGFEQFTLFKYQMNQ